MNLAAILDAVVAVQTALTITSPIATSIKAVHRYPPNRQSVLPDTPCWMNGWTFNRVEDQVDFDGNQRYFYTINAQLFIKEADLNQGAAIATAFHQKWIDAVLANAALNGPTIHNLAPRGGDPTLVMLEWAGVGFIGLNEYLDVEFMI